MSKIPDTQMIIQVNDYLLTWIEGFLIDRKARGLTKNTILYYSRKLKQFNEFAETQNNHLQIFLLKLQFLLSI